MRFNLNTEKRDPNNLFPGIAKYKVVHCQEKISKAGNEMLVVQLEIVDSQNNIAFIYDYLVSNQGWKIKSVLESCNLGDKFNTGDLGEEDLMGATGFCEIGVLEDKSGRYQPKMGVIKYLPENEGVELWANAGNNNNLNEQVKSQATPDFDDDIPF